MEFYLQLTDRFNFFRFQTDGTWRRTLRDEDLHDGDYTTPHALEIVRQQRDDLELVIDGERLHLGRGGSLFHQAMVSRDRFPAIPSKEQLRSIIRYGDDSITNSLILNVYGFFELRNFFTMKLSIADPTLVFRYETFGAENGYVGGDNADDDRYIDDLYTTFLEGWVTHLRNGITNMYFSSEARRPEAGILAELKGIEDEWTEALNQE